MQQYRLLVEDGQLVDRPFRQVATALIGAFDEVLADWLLTAPRPSSDMLLPVLDEVFLSVFHARSTSPVDK